MISQRLKGNFNRLEKFLNQDISNVTRRTLNKYGEQSTEKLKENTPVRTGLTRASWSYKIKKTNEGYTLQWINTNVSKDGVPIVVLLEYGHGTSSGGYVPPQSFIRKTLRPYLERIGAIAARNIARNKSTYDIGEEVNDNE